MYNHFRYSESKSHSSSIYIFRFSDASKKFEKFVKIFLFNPDTCIFNRGNEFIVLEINIDLNTSLKCEFWSITHKIKKNLFVPFKIDKSKRGYLGTDFKI